MVSPERSNPNNAYPLHGVYGPYAFPVQGEIKVMPARFNRRKAAATLGALGASKGGIARAKSLTPKARKTIAQKAANTRWSIN